MNEKLIPNLSLNPAAYFNNDIFSTEKERLFGRLWIFAGLTSFIKKNDMFISRSIASTPIFIQNIDNSYAAFINKCPHRLSPIRTENFGQKKMTCPFHGWSFNNDGTLKVIPNQHLYNFNYDEKENINLTEVNLKIIGKFIFINLDEKAIPIETQFSKELIADIESVSSHMDSQIAYGNFETKYNWKLNLEVIKDSNHIPFVHPKTFMSWMEKAEEDIKNKDLFKWEHIQSVNLMDLSYKTQANIIDSNPWYRKDIKRYGSNSNHISWYLYPNTHFASVRGDYFFIQQYDPCGPSDMNFLLWIMTAERLNQKQDFTALIKSLIDAERDVIEEDIKVLTSVQKNFGHWSSKPIHGAYEVEILRQNFWYKKNILCQ